MTVWDASLKLYEWFCEKDAYIEDDFMKMIIVSETPERDKAAIQCALREMEKNEMICHHDKWWILKRDLKQVDQDVKLSYLTALNVSYVVNSFCDVTGNEKNKCTPDSISEENIRGLCYIAQTMAGMSEEEIENNNPKG
jgi:hypothetical protein